MLYTITVNNPNINIMIQSVDISLNIKGTIKDGNPRTIFTNVITIFYWLLVEISIM
jgi:hypothetical protein